MGKNTEIAWCDNTFNSWWGCKKVSAGCEHCYAKTLANRWGFGHMYSMSERRFFGDQHWNEPVLWNKEAQKLGVHKSVFCSSMGDVFDDPEDNYETACLLNGERDRLWQLILKTPYLDWLLLTKRPENIQGLIYYKWNNNNNLPDNVRIGVTCENQEMADKRIPILLNSWKGKNFISVEPMLNKLEIVKYLGVNTYHCECGWHETENELMLVGAIETNRIAICKKCGKKATIHKGIDWVICGCESGTSSRPCNIEWIRDLRDQCVNSGTPFFLKQMSVDGKLVKEPFIDGRQWLEFPKN